MGKVRRASWVIVHVNVRCNRNGDKIKKDNEIKEKEKIREEKIE